MDNSTINDLTIDQLKTQVREVVIQTLTEMICDPNEGLELREDIKVKIERSLSAMKTGENIIPAKDVAAKLGLTR